MKLYNYWRSSSSWRVRIALAYKNVPYEYVPVHLVRDGGEQYRDEFRAKNPRTEVPVLEVVEGGKTHFIAQSLAMIEYLEQRFPAPALLPTDLFMRSKVRQIAEMVNAGIQPFQNLSVLQHVNKLSEGADKAWAQHFIRKGVLALEVEAKQWAGAYLVGDTITMADCCLVPQLYSARRFGVDLTECPTLLRVESACAEHPAFASAHADKQPDAIAAS